MDAAVAKKYNADLDNFLQTTETIPLGIWNNICDAIAYDAATTVNWACHKLKIIYLRVQQGEKIYFPDIDQALDKSSFEKMIVDHFGEHCLNWILEYKFQSE